MIARPAAMTVTVIPAAVRGTLAPPPSKSYAQRALAAALLAGGTSLLHNIGCCDDTLAALRCIEALGARTERLDPQTLAVHGGLQPATGTLHVGESGLAARLFTPVAALCDRPVRIEGAGTLLRRPMGPMLDALQRLGARIEASGDRLPIEVRGPLRGGETEIDGSLSSQFTTGLLLVLPLATADTTLRIRDAVSTPYVDMTAETVRHFGAEICYNDHAEFYIPGGQRYRAAELTIEGDWSAAAMLLAAGATAGEVIVRNLRMLSTQGDTAVCEALVRAGAAVTNDERTVTAARRPLRAFAFDATHCPDLIPALTALAAACDGVSELRGAARLEHKECNRRDALREQYGRLGIAIETPDPDTMLVRGGRPRAGCVDACGDHRIAMSLAVAALRAEGPVRIEGAECVAKSYPDFFGALEGIAR